MQPIRRDRRQIRLPGPHHLCCAFFGPAPAHRPGVHLHLDNRWSSAAATHRHDMPVPRYERSIHSANTLLRRVHSRCASVSFLRITPERVHACHRSLSGLADAQPPQGRVILMRSLAPDSLGRGKIGRRFRPAVATWHARRRLITLTFSQPALGTLLVLISLGWAGTPLLQAIVVGRLIDQVVILNSASAASSAIVVLSALLIISEIFSSVRRLLADHLADKIDQGFRRDVRRRLGRVASLSAVEDQQNLDDVARAGDVGPNEPRSPGAAATGQLLLMSRFVSTLLLTIPLSLVSPAAAIALLLLALLNRGIVRRDFIRLAASWDSREWARRRASYWTDVAMSPSYATDVRIFALSDWVVRQRSDAYVEWIGDMFRTTGQLMRKQIWIVFLTFGSASLALAVPGHAALSGRITTGELGTVLMASLAVLGISAMGYEAFDIEHGLETVTARDRLRSEPTASNKGAVEARRSPSTPTDPIVALREVSFSYPTDKEPTIKDLTLELRRGEVVALVGLNGAGKTTLIKLLCGLYPPHQGTLEVDDRPLLTADSRRHWQGQVSVVFQDFVKYPLTVRQNICMGAPEIAPKDSEVWHAAELAQCSQIIERLPRGLDTILAPYRSTGVDLSGGQWQRLALARSIFGLQHGRRLLILDEPTANLDIESESNFFKDVISQLQGVPTLLISHRLTTVKNSDSIVLLSDGGVREIGSHDALMAAEGEYASLFRLQASQFGKGVP